MEVAERKRFPKSERLRLKKNLDQLFNNGQSFVSYPLKIVYLSKIAGNPSDMGIRILISVPKIRFKSAVQRNNVKRLIREAYRLNKNDYTSKGKSLYIAMIYVSNEIVTFANMEKAILKALTKIGQSQEA